MRVTCPDPIRPPSFAARCAVAAVGVLTLAAAARHSCAQSWVPGPTVPTVGAAPRAEAVALWANSSLMVFGGLPLDGGGDAPVQQLLASWTTRPSLEGDFRHLGAAVDSLGRTIVFGGENASGDPGEGFEWTIPDGNNGNIANRSNGAPKQRFAVATDAAGLVYAIGGSNGSALVAAGNGRVERYDANADVWSVLSALPTPVTDAAACVDAAGYVVVFGGYDVTGARSANVARYNAATDTWSDTEVQDLPIALAGAEAVLGADGRIYVLGGTDGAERAATLVLDPSRNTWIAGPTMGHARAHFGATLDPLGNIWCVGGDSTNSVESLFTPTCPSVVRDPAAAIGWLGASAGFEAVIAGTGPFVYQWRRDGQVLVDGLTATGSEIVGAATAQIGIIGLGAGDEGAYDCVVSNACGFVTTTPAPLTTREGAMLPTTMTSRALHPPGALGSKANGVDHGLIVGEATYSHPQYNQLSHPMLWQAAGGPAQDLTPSGSVGGSVAAIRGDAIVGWWWWPYTNQFGTGYYRHACVWENSGNTHREAQTSGWEIGSIAATDGVAHVGSQLRDETAIDGHAFYWTGNNRSPRSMTPPNMRSSSGAAIDNGTAFGSVHIGFGVVHAAMWQGINHDFVDMNPPGASSSSITAAGDGLQVGSARFSTSTSVPGMWSGSASSFVPFPTIGGATIAGSATRQGLVVGAALIGGTTHAVAFRTSDQLLFDLHPFAPPQYTITVARDLEIDPVTGALTVVGYGFDPVSRAYEALVWQSASILATTETYGQPCPTALVFTPDGVGGFDVERRSATWRDDSSGVEIGSGMIAEQGVSAPVSLPFAFAMPGGAPTSAIVVGDNGRIFAAGGVSSDALPAVGELLAGAASLAPLWTDLSSALGSVRVAHDPAGAFSVVTWRDVPQAGEANGLTFQVVLHGDGRFEFAYAATAGWLTDPATGASAGGDDLVVGCSAGNQAADPGAQAFTMHALATAGVPTVYQQWLAGTAVADVQPHVVADSLPKLGANFDFAVEGVSSSAFFAFLQIGFSNPNQDLAPLGLIGCRLYASADEPLRPLSIHGSRALTSIPIPNQPSFLGMEAYFQAAVLAPGEGPLGILTTDGMHAILGR